MNFTSPLYFYFLVLLFLLFRLFSRFKRADFVIEGLLLLSSYFFYSVWNPNYLFLILIPTVTDFLFGKLIFESKHVKKKIYLFLSLCLDLSILGFFKYGNFAIETLNMLNIGLNMSLLDVLLPAGISFYTFQSMSYTIDIYRNKISPEKSIFRYALYLSFFPQLVAGPIVVARELLPKLRNLAHTQSPAYTKIFWLLLLGFTKKAIIADRIAPSIDLLYAYPDSFTAQDWALGVLAYSVQIYCDFSGYTDIARGSALLFGIELPENFLFPYLSTSFSEFWRRWHITLSTWLRDYLYISLGGNRSGVIRTMVNLLLTMLLGGLWHGASWNFILWGAGHGILLSIERIFEKWGFWTFPVGSTGGFYQKVRFLTLFSLRRTLVFLSITLLWVLFRSKDLGVSLVVYSKIFSDGNGFHVGYSDRIFLLSNILLVFLANIIGFRYADRISAFIEAELSWKMGIFFIVWAYIALSLSRETRPFLYFVF